jgi:GDPmannose 4,6-dehydratase
MLQQESGDDYVIATGEMHTVRDFLDASFGLVGMDWQTVVKQDERFTRPTEVDHLCGDATKAERVLGWKPKTTFEGLVRMMVVSDLEGAKLDPEKFIKN